MSYQAWGGAAGGQVGQVFGAGIQRAGGGEARRVARGALRWQQEAAAAAHGFF